MLVRVIAACSSLLLVSCEKASPPAPPAAAPVATPAAPSPDTRKAIYELQEKCARDARDWYKHWWEDAPSPAGASINTNYTNHYNAKVGRCFILVTSLQFAKDKKTGKVNRSDEKELVDVLENRGVGTEFIWQDLPINMQCEFNEKECHSAGEWEVLAKPYMED
jgi:hypothetical protein